VRYSLEAIRRGADGSMEEGQALEASLFGLSFATEDRREGAAAFLEKREPKFKGC
jgi:enoyl-CoA hydratase/carnithine racemase